jgi:hypothetical protein
MNFGAYGILIVFGAFVLLLILNPNLSCFGKRIKSPLYPLLRKRAQREPKRIRTESYGFDLGSEKSGATPAPRNDRSEPKQPAGEDYGFRLQDTRSEPPAEPPEPEAD